MMDRWINRYILLKWQLEDNQSMLKERMKLWKKRRAERIPEYNPEGIDEVTDPRKRKL